MGGERVGLAIWKAVSWSLGGYQTKLKNHNVDTRTSNVPKLAEIVACTKVSVLNKHEIDLNAHDMGEASKSSSVVKSEGIGHNGGYKYTWSLHFIIVPWRGASR